MSHDTSLRWRSVFLGVLALLVVLTCYLGSHFWWMRYTKSGQAFYLYFSRHDRMWVQTVFSAFYRPARALEREWCFARYRKLLPGTWASESGDMTMEVRNDLMVEVSGLGAHGFRDRIVFTATDPTSAALVLSSAPTNPRILVYPLPDPNQVGIQIMLPRGDWDDFPTMKLGRTDSQSEKSARTTP